MRGGFPVALIPLLRCSGDGGELLLRHGSAGAFIQNGAVACATCKREYPVEDGILDMLGTAPLDDESRHERKLRDGHERIMPADQRGSYDDSHNRMEMVPTLEALNPTPEADVLELGCGDGRYTVGLASRCRTLLAVDFSRPALARLSGQMDGHQRVGLVLGDVASIAVQPRAFDRVFCTLMSNLPTRGHRDATYRLAARAVRPSGRFVYSTHHQSLRDRLAGRPKSGRYRDGGIYRYNFDVAECRAEAAVNFRVVTARPVRVYLPLSRTLRLPVEALSRIAERVPLVNRLGELVLCTAAEPVGEADRDD